MVDLQELKELEAAATPAPWYLEQPAMGFSGFRDVGKNQLLLATAAPSKECPRPEEDHTLLLALRNSAPTLLAELEASRVVCGAIQEIMRTYREQEASDYGVDTPGGLEHMGDVWRLLSKWDAALAQSQPVAEVA